MGKVSVLVNELSLLKIIIDGSTKSKMVRVVWQSPPIMVVIVILRVYGCKEI